MRDERKVIGSFPTSRTFGIEGVGIKNSNFSDFDINADDCTKCSVFVVGSHTKTLYCATNPTVGRAIDVNIIDPKLSEVAKTAIPIPTNHLFPPINAKNVGFSEKFYFKSDSRTCW